MGTDFLDTPMDLLGLALRCPKGQRCSNCPAIKLQNLPLEEVVSHIESLSPEQVRELRQMHRECWEEDF